MIDQLQIERLLIQIAVSQDVLDWKLFASCWTQDAKVHMDVSQHLDQYGIQDLTTAELSKLIHSQLSGFTGTQHALANFLVDFADDGKSAVARANCTAYHYLNEEGKPETDTSIRAIMIGAWELNVSKDKQGIWRADGIKVTRDIPIVGSEELYGSAKARAARGEGRKELSVGW